MQLDEFVDIDLFMKEIEEGQDDISDAMRKQTARCAYYGIQHSKAKKQCAKVNLAVKTVDALLTKKFRKELIDNEERPTGDILKALVVTDPKMAQLLKIQMDADEIETICKVCYDAFKTRRDMLTGLGHLTTQSMRTGHQITVAREAVKGGYQQRRSERQAAKAAEAGEGSQVEATD